MKNFKPLLLALTCAWAVAACNRVEDPEETRLDVAKASADADAEVAEAQRAAANTAADAREEVMAATNEGAAKVADAKAQALADNAEARFDLALAKADGDMKVAEELCDALPVPQQDTCSTEAKAAYEAAKYEALATKDSANNTAEAMKQ